MTIINYYILLRILLPIRLRTGSVLAWLDSLIAPIRKTLYPRFKNFEEKAWHDLKYQSGQVAYLEFVLNNIFHLQGDIWIGPGNYDTSRLYLYTTAENHPLFIYSAVENEPIYLYTTEENTLGYTGQYDFTINVPSVFSPLESRLRAIANRYKRDGKTYKIIYY